MSEDSVKFKKVHISDPMEKGSYLSFGELWILGPTKFGIFEFVITKDGTSKSVFLDATAVEDLTQYLSVFKQDPSTLGDSDDNVKSA